MGDRSRDVMTDPDYQDRVEASALYDVLEREIVARFYDRPEGPVPRRWIERVKAFGVDVRGPRDGRQDGARLRRGPLRPSRGCGPLHVPCRARARSGAGGVESRVRGAWESVQVIDVEGDVTAADVGVERDVAATVRLGDLSTDDISVELAHGRVGANNELVDPEVTEMKAGECVDQTCVYHGRFNTEAAGLYGFTVRVIPSHPDLTNQMDLGLVTSAS